MTPERERLEREVQEMRGEFDRARSVWESLDTQANIARGDMEVARTLGLIREEALRIHKEQERAAYDRQQGGEG